MWFVYILECKDGSFYTGVTDNVERRFSEHCSGKGGRYTKLCGVVKIAYTESHSNKSDALKRESQIKGWTRRKKLALAHGNLELLKKL